LVPEYVNRAILNQPNHLEVRPEPASNALQINSPPAAASSLHEQVQPMLGAVVQPQRDEVRENPLVQAPVPAPVSEPVDAPVAAPVAAPVDAPEAVPVDAPVSDPIRYEPERFTAALNKGRYADAARLMNAREPRLTPTEMARELVQDHYAGKALPTRLVQFALAAFTGDQRTQEAAEFLLAAHGIPNEVPDDLDAMVKPLADSLLLWQASGQSDVDALGAALGQKLEAHFPNAERVKTKANELSAPRLADQLDFDALGEPMSEAKFFDDLDNMAALKLDVSQQIAERIKRNGYLAVKELNRDVTQYPMALTGQNGKTPPDKRLLLAGSKMAAENVYRVENSFLRNPNGILVNASLRNCVIHGHSDYAAFNRADLTGSELKFEVLDKPGTHMRSVSFTGAILDNAEVLIDYSKIDELVAKGEANGTQIVVGIMNHLDTTNMRPGSGVLTAIDSIDDRYAAMKLKLMREALEFIGKHGATESLSEPLFDVLSRNPIYASDPSIRRIVAPIMGKLAIESLGEPRKAAFLAALLASTGSEGTPAMRASFVRENMEGINTLLHAVEQYPQIAEQPGLGLTVDALRKERDALAELVPLKTVLDDLMVEYTRADGTRVDTQWYFMLADDGTIAALNSEHYNSVKMGDPAANLIENTMFFMPAAQKYGDLRQHYYTVDGSSHVMLVNGNIKERARSLINRFPPLKAHYELNRLSPSNNIAENLFASDPVVLGWFRDAFKGMSLSLNPTQILQLSEVFRGSAPAHFKDYSTIASTAKWHETRLTENFMNTLRKVGMDLADVPTGDDRAFAHFLFSLSATFTRLSSEKVFGDGQNSINELRYMGYALFKTAREIQPSLLSEREWSDFENRFLNPGSCAEILSRNQLKASKAIDPKQFLAFTPGVFKTTV
jgi:hypothetical protein